MSSVQTSEVTATLATQCRFLDIMVIDGEICNFFSFCRNIFVKCIVTSVGLWEVGVGRAACMCCLLGSS
jgi:hypothetical protein